LNDGRIKVGIGFATGRRHFKRVLRSYVYNWKESELVDSKELTLNLFVAYDLNYKNTKKANYTKISSSVDELLFSKHFIGQKEVEEEKRLLIKRGIVDSEEASLVFGKGYASQRNIVLYSALKNHIDCLLYLDDDEYPVAVTNDMGSVSWMGQHVLKTHLNSIDQADITYGYHCGYISPIPYIEFSPALPEDTFRLFIEAISNDIVKWETLRKLIQAGGVSYADPEMLNSNEVFEVEEINHAKFISGSNLCLSLKDPSRVFPFYNPPGARGEDTFLSTCLSDRRVLKVPSYAFHNAFSTYNHILMGVLPTNLKPIRADSREIVRRFYRSCIGWIRYKPLLLYITDRDNYSGKIEEMKINLRETLPSISSYFGTDSFYNISRELNKYHKSVEKHYEQFERVKEIWSKISDYLREAY
jgi:hypothetical protein